MIPKKMIITGLLLFLTTCASKHPSATTIGHFQVERDLILFQFDCKTDVDDVHSIAAVATLLADRRFSGVRYHAVAGTYGIQEGLYVPANPLFDSVFGKNWSDAHSDKERALHEVSLIVSNILNGGGHIWIAEAGQSDFSADLIRKVRIKSPGLKTRKLIHIVQHSDWNESSTAPDNLNYVKVNADYHKIPDGNAVGNGSPGFKTDRKVNWPYYITQPKLINIWNMAIDIANQYNGKDNRYNNSAIANGGMDFSDVSETCWIFGFEDLQTSEDFFKEFSSSSGR